MPKRAGSSRSRKGKPTGGLLRGNDRNRPQRVHLGEESRELVLELLERLDGEQVDSDGCESDGSCWSSDGSDDETLGSGCFAAMANLESEHDVVLDESVDRAPLTPAEALQRIREERGALREYPERAAPVATEEHVAAGVTAQAQASQLPIQALKADIVEMVQGNQVSVVCGATGSGKTTQVPRFILEADPTANIIVAQPRRIAAVGAAERIAAEIGEPVGAQIG